MSEMPVFDDVPPETSTPTEQPPKRKPRKPMKRRARAVPVAPKRIAKKRAARRGRPPGVPNKVKPIADNSPSDPGVLLSVASRTEALLSVLAPVERKLVLEHLLKLS